VIFGSDWPFAARLYGEGSELQPVIDDVFAPDERAAVWRGTVAVQIPRVSGPPAEREKRR
jgi:hypothetical protein